MSSLSKSDTMGNGGRCRTQKLKRIEKRIDKGTNASWKIKNATEFFSLFVQMHRNKHGHRHICFKFLIPLSIHVCFAVAYSSVQLLPVYIRLMSFPWWSRVSTPFPVYIICLSVATSDSLLCALFCHFRSFARTFFHSRSLSHIVTRTWRVEAHKFACFLFLSLSCPVTNGNVNSRTLIWSRFFHDPRVEQWSIELSIHSITI